MVLFSVGFVGRRIIKPFTRMLPAPRGRAVAAWGREHGSGLGGAVLNDRPALTQAYAAPTGIGAVSSAVVLALSLATGASASAGGFSNAWNNSNSVNQCLALASSKLGNATVMWTCDNESGQKWQPADNSRGDLIQNGVQDACLDGMGYGQGNHVYVEPCNGGLSQEWLPVLIGSNNYIEWENVATSLCLSVAGGSTANGATVITWKCQDTADQQWGGSLAI
ncbi:MAG TPA: RICIN domain-containing protein [Actinocrinis sp.]|nr:RICIN domain-containing protein [Actinocrinis sp.]